MFKDFLLTPGIAPPWLLGAIGRLKLQMLGSTIDQLTGEGTGKSSLAAEAAMPMKADPTALPFIGQDRLITQGVAETTAAYRPRLRSYLDTWRTYAANDWGVMTTTLLQVTGTNGATAPRIRIVSNSSSWNWYEAGADTTQPPWHWQGHVSGAGFWSWDIAAPFGPDVTPGTESGAWWRWWMALESVGGAAFASQWTPLGTGGDPNLGNLPGSSLGFANLPSSFWTNLRTVLAPWIAANTYLRWFLVTFSTTVINPGNNAGGGHNPDGTWGYGFKIVSGQYTATWIANVLPVPGLPTVDPPGSSNYVTDSTFGFRISQGQYVTI